MTSFQKTIIACLLMLLPVTSLSADAQQPRAKPSLDVLLIRVKEYWALLQKGKKLQALEYVTTSSRENFLAIQTPGFSDPRVSSLTLTAKPDEISVTVNVKRVLPQLGTLPVDWPVNEKWVFRNGNWFVVTAGRTPPYALGPGRKAKEPLSPEEVERRRNDIRTALHFDNQIFDLGTVRKGVPAPIEIKYSLSGSEPIAVELSDAPPDLTLAGLPDRKLQPGNGQSISMEWMTSERDGPVSAHFALLARLHDVEVSFPFEVKGDIYSPVSAQPNQIIFPRGERKTEFVVRNNSRSEVSIRSYSSQTGIFEVSSVPQIIPPGGQAVMNVRTTVAVDQKNFKDLLSLAFDQPVEGMASVIVPITLNYEKPLEEKRIMGLTQKQLDELLRKAPQPPIKP